MTKKEKLINENEIEAVKVTKLGPEEKIKQQKIIPYLRDVLGYKLMDFEVPIRFRRMTKYADIVIYIVSQEGSIYCC